MALANQAAPTPCALLPKMATVKVGNKLSLQTGALEFNTLISGQLQLGTVMLTVSRQANESDWV